MYVRKAYCMSSSCLQVTILPTADTIGAVTVVICIFGVFIGNLYGSRFSEKAAIAGGIILILIGRSIWEAHVHIIQEYSDRVWSSI